MTTPDLGKLDSRLSSLSEKLFQDLDSLRESTGYGETDSDFLNAVNSWFGSDVLEYWQEWLNDDGSRA